MGELLGDAKALVEAGAVALLVLHIVLDFVGLWRKWWAPGFWLEEKAEALKGALAAQAELRTSNDELRVSNAELRTENVRLRADLGRERRRRPGDA